MRDEMDGRMWAVGHDEFSEAIENGLVRLRDALLALPGPVARQLIAGVGAIVMALLTVGGSVA